ncbi:MAG: hypothetical protein ACK5LL_13215 [Suipraeoptans sp.]
MEEANLSDFFELFTSLETPVLLGAIAAFVSFVFVIVIQVKGVLDLDGDKKIKKATERGHVVKGTRVKIRFRDRYSKKGGNRLNRTYASHYECVIDGRTITKSLVTANHQPPRTLTFYYIDSPNKLFSEYDVAKNPLKVLVYILPFVIGAVVMKLFELIL